MRAVMHAPAHFAAMAPLFAYPGNPPRVAFQRAAVALHEACPAAVTEIYAFLRAAGEGGGAGIADAYTRAFDLGPQAPPYLSVYLFGAESYKRSELMSGLIDAYARCGFERGGELPDHVAVVLAAAPHLPEDEWEELAAYCLPGPLKAMHQALRDAHNPYAHVVRAAQALLGAGEMPS